MPVNPFLAVSTPVNLLEERDKFFSSSSYHPVFRYDWDNPKSSADPRRQSLIDAIIKQDVPQIVKSAQDLFEVTLDSDTLKLAHTAIANKIDTAQSGSAQEFAQLLRSALAEFKISYTVEIVDQPGFNARPIHNEHKLQVSNMVHFEMFSMQGGIRHDLVHIMRQLNGKHNQIKRSSRYLPTEEGLASFAQDHVAGVEDNGLVQHALEYLGTKIGLEGSLRDIYEFMRENGMSADLAWKRASRHKFGFVDTKSPGDIIKPAMYFANEQKVTSLTQDEKLRLFVGKIALSELPQHPQYQGLWPTKQLIEFFSF